MEKAAVSMIVIALGCVIWAFLQQPIIKLSTPQALDSIERNYLRSDLSSAEKSQLASYTHLIRGNQDGTMSAYRTALLLLALVGGVTVLQSLWIVRLIRRQGAPTRPPEQVHSRLARLRQIANTRGKMNSKRKISLAVLAAALFGACVFGGVKVVAKRQLAAFQGLTAEMRAEDVMREHGKPAKTDGSGVMFLRYRLVDGSEVVVTCGSERRVVAVAHEGRWLSQFRPL